MTAKTTINVLIYSYKGRFLKDVLTNLLSNQSGDNDIFISLIDQHPLRREETFAEFKCRYNHVFWDHIYGPSKYRRAGIKYSQSDYTLILGDNVLLNKDWDKYLVSIAKDNILVSGNHSLSIKQKDLFFIQKELEKIDQEKVTQFTDRSLIFASKKVLSKIRYPEYIKYYGEEEGLSLECYTLGIDILAAKTSLYSCILTEQIENIYTPFSLFHNYNEVIELFYTGKNKYVDMNNRARSVEDFINFHKFNFAVLKKLPFETNDVQYDPEALLFNSVNASKFVARTKSIR